MANGDATTEPRELDQHEAHIIRCLQRDGRMPTSEIAREIGISEPTVRRKLARLLEDGTITIRAVADPFALGYAAPAYIGINVDRQKIEEVARVLAAYPMIETVAVVTGPSDLLIKAAFRSTDELYGFILKELIRVEGIRDTDTLFVLKSFKHTGLEETADIRSAAAFRTPAADGNRRAGKGKKDR